MEDIGWTLEDVLIFGRMRPRIQFLDRLHGHSIPFPELVIIILCPNANSSVAGWKTPLRTSQWVGTW